jgi:hypothetical protein
MSTAVFRVVEMYFNLNSRGYEEFGWFMFVMAEYGRAEL